MPSPFAELDRITSDAVDDTMAEMTRIEPRAQGGMFSGSADEDRAVIEVAGVVDFAPVTLITKDTAKYDGARPAISGDKLHVSYGRRHFTTWSPRVGDIIVLIERDDENMRITRIDHDGLARFVCVCEPAPE